MTDRESLLVFRVMSHIMDRLEDLNDLIILGVDEPKSELFKRLVDEQLETYKKKVGSNGQIHATK